MRGLRRDLFDVLPCHWRHRLHARLRRLAESQHGRSCLRNTASRAGEVPSLAMEKHHIPKRGLFVIASAMFESGGVACHASGGSTGI